jgi:hypothetical protein
MSSWDVAQVIGTETLRTRDVRETHQLIIRHIARLREIKNLERATIVLSLESNLAFESQHIIHAIQAAGVKKWVALQEGAGGTLGCEQFDRTQPNCLFLIPFSNVHEFEQVVNLKRTEGVDDFANARNPEHWLDKSRT